MLHDHCMSQDETISRPMQSKHKFAVLCSEGLKGPQSWACESIALGHELAKSATYFRHSACQLLGISVCAAMHAEEVSIRGSIDSIVPMLLHF